jgi:excisionase family DNA binding protein
MPIESPFLTPREAADFLRITPRTLLRWEEAGHFRALRPNKQRSGGGAVLYRKADLLGFIDGCSTPQEVQPQPKKRGRPRKVEAV